MITAIIKTVYGTKDVSSSLGSKFLDLSIDLSAAAAHDCPPISLYRIALRERVWLRQLYVSPGYEVKVGALLARFTTELDESLDGEASRAVRITVAGIIDPSEWWVGKP